MAGAFFFSGFSVIIASVVTTVQLLMQAWFYELYQVLGIFIPLIVTNCAIIGRAEAFASRHSPAPSVIDGLGTGLGFCITLVLLGGLRELAGHGTLLRQASLMFGQWGNSLQIDVLPQYSGVLLAILPPGAFIGLGLLIAARNWIDSRLARSSRRRAVARPATGVA